MSVWEYFVDTDQSRVRPQTLCQVFKLKQKSVEIQRDLMSSVCLSVFVAGSELSDVEGRAFDGCL